MIQNSRFTFFLVVFSFLFSTLIVKAQVPDYKCKDLEESEGLLVKFKHHGENDLLGAASSPHLEETENAEKYLGTKIKKRIRKKLKKVKHAIRSGNLTQAKSKKLKKRAKKFRKLLKQHHLENLYVFDYLEDGSKVASTEKQHDCASMKALLNELDQDIEVEYVEPNFKVQILGTYNDPYYNSKSFFPGYDDLWGLKQIKGDQVGGGDGVVVAVIDTGINVDHIDLWDNIWVNPDVVSDRNGDGKINLDDLDLNNNKRIDTNEILPNSIGRNTYANNDNPKDDHGHGSHVAGTIGAVANNHQGLVGVAPNAKLLAVKGLGGDGSGYTSGLIAAVNYATQYADVINNSWGGGQGGNALREAFEISEAAGVVNLVAAGNSNIDAIYSHPAAFDTAITVGSNTTEFGRSGFSNYGNMVDIYAPGGGDHTNSSRGNIVSTYRASSNPNTYAMMAGTSMACPHAAGVAAQIVQIGKTSGKKFSTAEVKTIMKNAYTKPKASSNSDYTQILNGVIDAYEAISIADSGSNDTVCEIKDLNSNTISGYMDLQGTATSNQGGIDKYTIEYAVGYRQIDDSSANWVKVHTGNVGIKDGVLMSNFDTYDIPNGPATIRLSLVSSNNYAYFKDANYYNVANTGPRPEPPAPPAPVLSSLTPADNSTGVSIDTDLEITFDTKVALAAGVTGNIVELYKTGGSLVYAAKASDVNVSGKKVLVDLSSVTLDYATNYFAIVKAHVIEHKDDDRSKYEGLLSQTSWNFSTELDTTPPTDPGDGEEPSDPPTDPGDGEEPSDPPTDPGDGEEPSDPPTDPGDVTLSGPGPINTIYNHLTNVAKYVWNPDFVKPTDAVVGFKIKKTLFDHSIFPPNTTISEIDIADSHADEYEDNDLVKGSYYSVSIHAYDSEGNIAESIFKEDFVASDEHADTIIGASHVKAELSSSGLVKVSWRKSFDKDVVSYEIRAVALGSDATSTAELLSSISSDGSYEYSKEVQLDLSKTYMIYVVAVGSNPNRVSAFRPEHMGVKFIPPTE